MQQGQTTPVAWRPRSLVLGSHLAHDVDQGSQQRRARGVGSPYRDVAQFDAEIAQGLPYRGAVESSRTADGSASIEKAHPALRRERHPEPTRNEGPDRLSVADLGRQVQHHAARANRGDDVIVETRPQPTRPHQDRFIREIFDLERRFLGKAMILREPNPESSS